MPWTIKSRIGFVYSNSSASNELDAVDAVQSSRYGPAFAGAKLVIQSGSLSFAEKHGKESERNNQQKQTDWT
ncbi:MAG: hypothetical protein F6K31_42345 [Symploca sp. SIO2G7]|nr:hypothetical protein [Symploca sp. SIO2G7]